jgi:hypothetical protein
VELYIVVEREVSESNTETNKRTSMIERSALVVQLCNVRVRVGSRLVICYTNWHSIKKRGSMTRQVILT